MNKANFLGPVNLGNPSERTVKNLAELIVNKIGSNSKIIYKALPQDDPVKRQPDITIAKEKLGWTPVVDIDTGLNKTIKYFKNTLL